MLCPVCGCLEGRAEKGETVRVQDTAQCPWECIHAGRNPQAAFRHVHALDPFFALFSGHLLEWPICGEFSAGPLHLFVFTQSGRNISRSLVG